MNFSYLNVDNIFKKYADSKQFTESITKPFPEFQRIARNKPFEDMSDNYPKVTDGTTASIIRKTPRRIVQQVPTGSVETTDDDDWVAVVASDVYQNIILPNANKDYDLIQKAWITLESALTFGAAATYAPFISHDGEYSPDLVIPYWADVFLQAGKKSGYSCDYIFMRSWYQKDDIEAIIAQESDLKAAAKQRGEKYTPKWDVAALQHVIDQLNTKEDREKAAFEKDRQVNTTGIELVTGFQKGVGAAFITFNPDAKLVVRSKTNKDPRGKIPIDWMYAETEGSNPLGRGIVELIGGLQNMIDAGMQMYHYNRALMLDPPMTKRGNFNISAISFAPGAINDLGNDPTNSLTTMTVDTSALVNYPDLYGLEKSQLLNLVNSPDTSISAEVGNPGFGKTPAALSQQKATISIDDNYIRRMFEAWFQNWSETAINLFFAERTGVDTLKITDDTKDKLQKLADEGKFDINLINENNELLINYDEATAALKFTVDASTSKLQDESAQQDALTQLLNAVDTSATLQQLLMQYPDKLLSVWNKLVATSGVEDPEDITIDIKEFNEQQAQQLQQQDQSQLDPETQLADILLGVGASDGTIQQAIELANQGYSGQQILSMLGVSNG